MFCCCTILGLPMLSACCEGVPTICTGLPREPRLGMAVNKYELLPLAAFIWLGLKVVTPLFIMFVPCRCLSGVCGVACELPAALFIELIALSPLSPLTILVMLVILFWAILFWVILE